MKRLNWFGRKENEAEWFSASVPGNIQDDYARTQNWGDLNYGDNCKRYETIEDDAWYYRAVFSHVREAGKRCFFVTGGIDYEWELLLNGKSLLHHEGMFSSVECDLEDGLTEGENELIVKIYPHPKRADAPVSRDQADRSCKYPASYGWDWHPRILPSGIWNDAYLEFRTSGYVRDCEVSYVLSEDFDRADVTFAVDCDAPVTCELLDANGKTVYSGDAGTFTLADPALWWCN